ncbi:MAG: M4 family metallopeptidase [Bacteroidetes bacterium]|nr:M4 family metallopeptidase [Bacteroidota bacterium]
MRLKGILLLTGLICFRIAVTAQDNLSPNSSSGTITGYYAFETQNLPNFNNWQNAILNKLNLQGDYSWKIYSELKDELGQVHYRAQQYYQNIALENGVIVIHTKEGKILSFNGEIISLKQLSGKVVVTEETARARAIALFPSEMYYWQDKMQDQILQEITGNPDTSYFPKGEIVYCPQNLLYENEHKICYKFRIYSLQPLFGKTVYIDAETLEIVASEDLILHTDVKGKAVTAYSGTRAITTDSLAPGSFRLREKARGKGIETYNLKTSTTYGSAVDFTDADNYWNNVNVAKDEVATDAHWGAEKTYDFFDSILNRKSFDNSNAKIISYVHYSSNYANAFWNGSYMTYGDGNGSTWKPLTSLDVCGHEISHAVTTYTAGLVYSYESGALNESFSDIFGNAIEIWTRPTKHSWKIGEDFTTSGNGIRNMSNPNAYNHPKYYLGNKWYAGTGDNGGVHTNSGVQNYWFYLITDGVSGTNEKGNVFDIDSLGFLDASRIAYRNLSVYLTKNSQYADARIFSIMAAGDLFGHCSKHEIAVTNAWWVCGVGTKYDSGYVKANFSADTFACNISTGIKFSNRSENSASCKWYFGDGNNSVIFNPTYYYSSYGKFNIKLVAKSCFKNKYDSLTRMAYVVIDSTYDICNAVLMPQSGTDSVVKCNGFIYDDGGEGEYTALIQTNLKVKIPNATSIRFRFLVLDYENGYDSIVLFKNNTLQSNKIGRFTGQTLPFGGSWQTVTASALWLKHYSDPLVEGKGFKIEFEGIRNPLTVDLGADTTICFGDSALLVPKSGGGFAPDYRYIWSNGSTGNSLLAGPIINTKYFVTLKDVCTKLTVKDSVNVLVRQPLDVTLGRDTTICSGNSVRLTAKPKGGISTAYNYKWSNGFGNFASQMVSPVTSTTYMVVLNDGCTAFPDTAYQKVIVKPALKIILSASDSLVCIGQFVNLNAAVSGGDTSKYVVSWNPAMGNGFSKNVQILDTLRYIATVNDGCSVKSASDTLTIYAYPALQLNLNSDTTICLGTSVNINANVTGGLGSGYSYIWSNGKNTATILETPTVKKYFSLRVSDGCSPDISDSVMVDLFAPLKLTRVSDTVLCDIQTLPLNLLASGGRNSTYNISWNQAVTGFSVNLNPPAGITNYRAILSDACTVKNDTTNFKIQKLLPLNAQLNISPKGICMGDTANMNFVFSGGKTASYTWTLNAIPVIYKNQTIKPVLNTNYTLVLSDGCSKDASAANNILVYDSAFATLDATPDKVCIGDPVNFKYTSPDASEVRWYFSSNEDALGTAIDLPWIFKSSGNYTAKAKITTSNNCIGTFDLNKNITIVDYPVAGFDAVPGIATFDNPQIQFTDKSQRATSYFWQFGDGFNSNTSGDQMHIYNDTGWYSVSLAVSVDPGCVDTISKMVRIKDVYKLFRPLAFTPDGNTINDQFVTSGRGIKKFHMVIYNRWGMKVFESDDMHNGWTGIDENGIAWSPGNYIYLINILDTDEQVHTEKGVVTLLR